MKIPTKRKKPINYRKLFSIQRNLGKIVKIACPEIDEGSGIYFYIREDENGKYAYIGKAKNLLQRNINHLQGRKQPIDRSIKSRGYYSLDNLGGWKLNILHFPLEELDKREQYFIRRYRNAGYELYNVESGGTLGKTLINERKASKGYYEGIANGKKKICQELNYIIDKYLLISLKKENKLSQKALAKFYKILSNTDTDKDDKKGETE